MAGDDVGPLGRVPWGCKDLICTAGIKTVSGSHAYEDFVPDEDDVVVERMRDAGAVILGKTNVPEFGYSGVGHNPVFETTRNPWNTELTPGGSSAGSGAAVASGMGPVHDRQRWWRIGAHPEQLFGPVRPEGLDGSRAALSRCRRTSAIRASRAGRRSSTSAR